MKTLKELFAGHPCALPDHLKEKLHNDWPPLLNKIPRAWNARGPRCGKGNPGYMPWPPKLIEGYGVARWEDTTAASTLYFVELTDKHIKAEDFYGRDWTGLELNPGNPMFGQYVTIHPWWSELNFQLWPKTGYVPSYSPSALQKFSKKGWLKMSPTYYSAWHNFDMKEFHWVHNGNRNPCPYEDKVLFARSGWRPDHLDVYYNRSAVSGGLHWE